METDKQTIYSTLKREFEPYAPPLSVRSEGDRFELWSEKEVEIAGRKRKEVFFGGLTVHKNHIGLHYMPVYTHDEARGIIPDRLLGLLKGKSCFHVQELDDELIEEVREALAKGFELYRTRGWV